MSNLAQTKKRWLAVLLVNTKRATFKQMQVEDPKFFAHLLARFETTNGKNLPVEPLYQYLSGVKAGRCRTCSGVTKFDLGINRYREFCSYACTNASTSIVERRNVTVRERYGVDNAFQSKKLMTKAKRTMKQRYGVENPNDSKELAAKKRITTFNRTGYHHHAQDPEWQAQHGQPFTPEMLAQARETCLARHGYANPFNSPAMQRKMRLAALAKYGANPGVIFGGFKWYTLSDRFGTEHFVQGYERFAVAWFSASPKVLAIETRTKQLPRFRYRDVSRKQRNYYPDLSITTARQHYIVEVKSEWTLNLALDTNIRKWRVASHTCAERGWQFIVVLYWKGKRLIAWNPKSLADLAAAGFPVIRQPQSTQMPVCSYRQ